VTLKIRYHDFEQSTRQTTTDTCISEPEDLYETAVLLLEHGGPKPEKPVRLLGITLSSLRRVGEDGIPAQLTMAFTGAGVKRH